MKSWLPVIKRLHLYLGVFFAPLLIFFLFTGCWQTLGPTDNPDAPKNWFQQLMDPLSSVHTSDFYPPEKTGHSHWGVRILVGIMALGMTLSTGLGIYLAFRLSKKSWPVVISLLLGVAVPVILLIVDW